MKKSGMIDLIIENFAKGNLKLKHHIQSITEQKRALKAKCESELSLFTKSDGEYQIYTVILVSRD